MLNRVLVEIAGAPICSREAGSRVQRLDSYAATTSTYIHVAVGVYAFVSCIGETNLTKFLPEARERERHRRRKPQLRERGTSLSKETTSVHKRERERKGRDHLARECEVRRERETEERSDWATTIVAGVKYCFPCQARRVYARITTRRLMSALPTAQPSINSVKSTHEISGWCPIGTLRSGKTRGQKEEDVIDLRSRNRSRHVKLINDDDGYW